MIPILFPAGATDFTTNGLGRLSDATECIVLEERNGAYELTMQYPVTGAHFGDITHSRIIYAQPADGKTNQPFRVYKIGKPLNGICEINAEHCSYQLSHIPVTPFTANSAAGAMQGLAAHVAETCPFTFWTNRSATGLFRADVPSSIRSLLGGQRGSILDVYGGEYEFDGYTVKLHGDRGYDRNVTLRYGKNITDIRQEENISNTYTGIMPYWRGGTGDGTSTGEEVTIMLTEKVLHSENAANFPYQRTIPLDLSDKFETQPTEEQLRAAATSYMTSNNIGVPAVTINVSFVPLWQTEEYKDIASLERVNLCDIVTVEFSQLGISTKAKVVKTEYDVLKERYKSIEIGESSTNLTKTIAADVKEKTDQIVTGFEAILKWTIEHQTELLTNPGDSHVIFKGLDNDGNVVYGNGTVPNPQEILIMNTTNPSTATQVLRINKSGIGFGDNINGPFTTAWTLDGWFNAANVVAGIMNANLIRAGIIADYGTVTWRLTSDATIQPGKGYYIRTGTAPNYEYILVQDPIAADLGSYYEISTTHSNFWNLETGEFQLQWNAKISDGNDNKTIGSIFEELRSYTAGEYVKSVEIQFAGSSSNQSAPSSGWGTLDSASGTYLWTRDFVTYYGGGTSTTDPELLGTTASLRNIVKQWYLSASSTTLETGSWSTETPSFTEGRYVWTRIYKPTSGTYTTPVLASQIATIATTQVSAEQLTQEKVFNLLTNNGQLQGIYMQNGQLYINGTYVKAGTIVASLLKLAGNMVVYQAENSSVAGGYIGFITGLVGFGNTTAGMHMSDATEHSHFVATNAGARMQAGSQQFYILYDTVDGATAGNGGLLLNGDLTVKIGGTLKLLDGNTEKTGANATYQFGNGSLQTYRGIVVSGTNSSGVGSAEGTEYQIGNANITISNGVVVAITPWTAASHQRELDDLANGKVSKGGDTMTGFLVLNGDPTSNMHAATKQYVDNAMANVSTVCTFG